MAIEGAIWQLNTEGRRDGDLTMMDDRNGVSAMATLTRLAVGVIQANATSKYKM